MKRTNAWNDFAEEEEDVQPSKKKLKNIEETSSESESSDDEAEICAICLGKLYKSQVGSPEGCDHVFCLKCILEWSKNVNTCPVDRMPFQIIFARESIDDNSAVIINVENRDNRAVDENDVTICEICHLGDREDRLLLCDGCNKGYHLECLTPPLFHVPVGDWFCEDCEVNSPGHSHSRSNRMIARTLIYQRVMRNIRQVTDSSEEDDSEEEGNDANDSEEDSEEEEDARCIDHNKIHLNVLRKAKQSGTKSSRRKKSTKGRSSRRKKGSKRKRRKSRRKLKRSIPSLFGESSKSGRQAQRYAFEQNSLSIFGNRLHLHSFKDDIPSCSTSKAEGSKDPTSERTSKAAKEEKKSFDILGEILNGQALLHSKSSDIVIGRDGQLKPLKPLPDMRLQDGKQPSGSTFFLRDICTSSSSSSIASPSISSTSSPRSSSFPNGKYPSSSYSQFSDFSDSSNDSHLYQVGPSYEESYNSFTKEGRNRSKDSNGESLQKVLLKHKKLLFDKPGEYSPVCNDDGDDSVGQDSSSSLVGKTSSTKEVLTSNSMDLVDGRKDLEFTEIVTPFAQNSLNQSKSSGQMSSSLQTNGSSSQSGSGDSKNSQQSSKLNSKEEEKSVDSASLKCNFVNIGVSSSINYSSASSQLESTESFEISVSSYKDDAGEEKSLPSREAEDDDSKMDIDFDDDDEVDDVNMKEEKVVTKEGESQQNAGVVFSKEEKDKKMAFVEKLMQESLKLYYMSKQINKDDYKHIMKKGVSKIMKSRDKRIEPQKVKKFVDQYVLSVLKKKLM